MPLPIAIPFAVLLILSSSIVAEAVNAPAIPAFVVIGTSLWVYFDAKKLDLGRYRTGLMNPEVVTIGCFLLWIIAFPWYLSARDKIRRGTMPLKEPPPGTET
ncbi:MAG TPA: hypothetical protein VFJ82_09620 [Longimicrobium sp.]|nr:hypothetical protein [Longimicrobium sp.]